MAKFKVGDVCVIIFVENYPELLGVEVTITGIPESRLMNSGEVVFGYPTDLIHDGMEIFPPENFLRLKTYPGEESVMKLFAEVTKRDVVPA